MLQPDDIPDWDTPLDQTTPKPPAETGIDGINVVLATAVAILAGVVVILLIVSAMIGTS